MESHNNKNNNNNDGGDEHQQLRGNAQNRKSNKLANDEDKPATTGDDDQNFSSNKNLEEGSDLDLEVESLSRKELMKLVRKQIATIMEMKAQKQLEAIKKEAEVSAKHTEIFLLKLEKAEVHDDLRQKMAEIVKMHKEVEEKAEELAEKAKQIEALIVQLNESREQQQHLMPTDEQDMKIQLSLETWYDWLAFVPRRQLGKIVPMIGDRRLASIIQKFLHEYREITINRIKIVAPYEEDPIGHPRVRTVQNNRPPLRFEYEMAETQMPANIKNFKFFVLSYFDQSVLNFIQKFQQNGLLNNVSLLFDKLFPKDILQPVLCHILPLINGIVSIYVEDSAQLVDIYDAGNSKEIYDLCMKMMEKTRLLGARISHESMHANKINLYCRWLYQTARADGKPRVLFLTREIIGSAPISLFIDRIKQDFLMAADPVTFFIRINLRKSFQPQEDICLDNGKTKERLATKMKDVKMVSPNLGEWQELVLLISRYPLASIKKWIVENEKKVFTLDFNENKNIFF